MGQKKHPFYSLHRRADSLWRNFPTQPVLKWTARVLVSTQIFVLASYSMLRFGRSEEEVQADTSAPISLSSLSWNFYHWISGLVTQYAPYWLVSVILASFVSWALQRFLARASASDSRRQAQVQDILDHFHRLIAPEDLKREYIYRLTLLRERKCFFEFFGKWLGVASRSPSGTHKKPKSIFSVNSENEDYCTGFAGLCWWYAQQNKPGPHFFEASQASLASLNSHGRELGGDTLNPSISSPSADKAEVASNKNPVSLSQADGKSSAAVAVENLPEELQLEETRPVEISVAVCSSTQADSIDAVAQTSYTEACGLAPCELSSLNHKSLKFLCHEIRDNSRVWGILVFDTDDPEWCEASTSRKKGQREKLDRKEELIKHAATALSILLRQT